MFVAWRRGSPLRRGIQHLGALPDLLIPRLSARAEEKPCLSNVQCHDYRVSDSRNAATDVVTFIVKNGKITLTHALDALLGRQGAAPSHPEEWHIRSVNPAM